MSLSSGPERRFWNLLRKRMRGRWDAQRHEDYLSSGIPDISYAMRKVDGWIELKALNAWPARETTLVDVGLRTEQANWLERRARAGSSLCWIFLRVGRDDYLLFSSAVVDHLAEKRTREDLEKLAVAHWRQSFPVDELCLYLSGRR